MSTAKIYQFLAYLCYLFPCAILSVPTAFSAVTHWHPNLADLANPTTTLANIIVILTCAPMAKVAHLLAPEDRFAVMWQFLGGCCGIMSLCGPKLLWHFFGTPQPAPFPIIVALLAFLLAWCMFFNIVQPASPDLFFMIHDNIRNIYYNEIGTAVDAIGRVVKCCLCMLGKKNDVASKHQPQFIDNDFNRLELTGGGSRKDQRSGQDRIASTPPPPYSPRHFTHDTINKSRLSNVGRIG